MITKEYQKSIDIANKRIEHYEKIMKKMKKELKQIQM